MTEECYETLRYPTRTSDGSLKGGIEELCTELFVNVQPGVLGHPFFIRYSFTFFDIFCLLCLYHLMFSVGLKAVLFGCSNVTP